ncbi:MAG TPA: Dam family site-specific DNA-(adenine-N6)-methyltransferase [Bacteroidales bacterium]|nr:Dam family site-specific DNA-(adenine-N6)-methyltransferase [Bacteroidales bacterium]
MKPFLKWAGGKYKLVPQLKKHFPKGKRFVEPFFGSGAVSLNVDYPSYRANDTNSTIVSLWQCIKDPKFIDYAETFFVPKNNKEATYYRFRKKYNENLKSDPWAWETAALFIYLNKHGYNGLCRYNSKGEFNVPFGHKTKAPGFPRKELTAAMKLAQKMEISLGDFRIVFAGAKRGDVIYCDPPYVPLTDTASFTNYSTGGFTLQDQVDLADCARKATLKGIVTIISNHDTPFTRKLYSGAKIVELKVQRSIGCKGKSRIKEKEILAIFQ